MLALLATATLRKGRNILDTTELSLREEVSRIIDEKNVTTLFQPIVCLKTSKVVGYEALSRGPKDSILRYPDKLFESAKKVGMLWELELLCRQKAIEKSKKLTDEYYLFLNVDPDILKDHKFQKGMTRNFLKVNNIPKGQIVFEVTEKTCVNDFENYRKLIDNYRNQGYFIALDDTGAGYSGLKMLMETHPNFIKIDMSLIRNIHQSSFKKLLLKQFSDFAMMTNIDVVAEGIESYEELEELIAMDISYGQGYLLGRPSTSLIECTSDVSNFIKEKDKNNSFYFSNSPCCMQAHQVTITCNPIDPTSKGKDVLDYFEKHPYLQCLPVVINSKPTGILKRSDFYRYLSLRYGHALFMDRSVNNMIDLQPLIIDHRTPLVDVSKAAMAREDNRLYDYIIVTKNDTYYGVITIKTLLDKAVQLELNSARDCNPLTKLPGNRIINENLSTLLKQNKAFSVLYIDLDNFKPFNDTYGFLQGDRVLVFTAELLKRIVEISHHEDFLGHIGGDDFIVITKRNTDETCKKIIAEFNSSIRTFYSQNYFNKDNMESPEQHCENQGIPILTISVAALQISKNHATSAEKVNAALSLIKKRCKSVKGSSYCVETNCVEATLKEGVKLCDNKRDCLETTSQVVSS